jgi:hypothetical protein
MSAAGDYQALIRRQDDEQAAADLLRMRVEGHSPEYISRELGIRLDLLPVAVERAKKTVIYAKSRMSAERATNRALARIERLYQAQVRLGAYRDNIQANAQAASLIIQECKIRGIIKHPAVKLEAGSVVVQVTNEDLLCRIARIADAAIAGSGDSELDA